MQFSRSGLLNRSAGLALRPVTPRTCLSPHPHRSRSRVLQAVPQESPAAADAAAAATNTAAAPPAADRSFQQDATSTSQRTDRRSSSKRKASSPSSSSSDVPPQVVLASGAATAAGALPDVLAATWPDKFPTLSAARRVIRKDLILVEGAVGSCKTEVAAGQLLQQLEPPPSKHKGPRTVSLEVLYEDDDLAVVHKPWGVKMYGGDGRRTITGAIRAGALNPSSSPDALPEPKPLHRLDAAVGGVLLIAKTAAAAADLSLQFAERRVHKVYHALLCGQLQPGAVPVVVAAGDSASDSTTTAAASAEDEDEEGSEAAAAVSSSTASSSSGADADSTASDDQQDSAAAEPLPPLPVLLQRQLQGAPAFSAATAAALSAADPNLQQLPDASSDSSDSTDSSELLGSLLGPGVHVVDLAVQGRTSYSLYQVLGYSRSARYGGWVTTVALSPVTGRKHQLRRHMAALGCPIVGDGKYALNKEEQIGSQGIFLESLELSFTHPRTRARLHVSMPEPARFATLRQQLHNRWRKLEGQQQQQREQQQEEEEQVDA